MGIENREWMKEIWGHIATKPINKIMIPGTHNSGTYTLNKVVAPWATTQDRTIAEQLADGIRFLDLRVKYEGGDSFIIVHSNFGGGSVTPMLDEIKEFLDTTEREILLVNFAGFNFESDEAQKKFSLMLTDRFWRYLQEEPDHEMDNVTPQLMHEQGHRMIITYNGKVWSNAENKFIISRLWWKEDRSVGSWPGWAFERGEPAIDTFELLTAWQDNELTAKRNSPVSKFWSLCGLLPTQGKVLAGSLGAVIGTAVPVGLIAFAIAGPIGFLLGLFLSLLGAGNTYGSIKELAAYVNPYILWKAISNGSKGGLPLPPINIYQMDFYNNMGTMFVDTCKIFNMGLLYCEVLGGGSGGKFFSDDLTNTSGIKSIKIKSGHIVDSMVVTYNLSNGYTRETPLRGNPNGGTREHEFTLENDEIITSLQCNWSKYSTFEVVHSIDIATNKRTAHLGAPAESGTSNCIWDTPQGLRGFWGRSEGYLDCLGVIAQTPIAQIQQKTLSLNVA